ncbi:MAG: sodium-coupled permease, partial [Gammaproteobacteria bacterium]|nr:sodium-coupled permease [Gammaproteobacteria bacterium]
MGLALVDWVIFLTYVSTIIFFGWLIGRKQTDSSQFFIANSKVSPLLIGASLFATLLSTISYLSLPGETINKGPMHLTRLFAYPLIFFVVGYLLLPKLMAVRSISIYERVEERLGLRMRLFSATMFILLRIFWMCLLINLTSNALLVMVGLSPGYLPFLIVIITVVALIYTSLGGIRAVMITDLIQTILLLVGGLAVLVLVSIRVDGFSWFPTHWQSQLWDEQPLFSLDLSTRVTFVGTVLTTFVWYVATQIGDQVSVQRFMASANVGAARTSLAINLLFSSIVAVTLTLVGFSLLGFFQLNPSELSTGLSLQNDADQIFPYFIAFHLPPFVSGIVLCGLFSAAMSSVDSGVNSISAVVMTDYVARLKGEFSDSLSLLYARWISMAIGISVIVFSYFIELVPGNIMEVTNKTVNLLSVPIFLVVAHALFLKVHNSISVYLG